MKRFMMVFADEKSGKIVRKPFMARDASDAFLHVRGHAADRLVELWKGSTRICALGPENNPA